MFEDELFAYVLELLTGEIAARPTPPPDPLRVDSWFARSVMQKAIRRGMTALALRAAAQLLILDARVLWRRLLVTALEDLGPGEADLMARIVAAMRSKAWRDAHGGDWTVAAELIAQACEGTRCQSANDLWNVAKNDPALDALKAALSDASLDDLLAMMVDEEREIGERGVAVLIALGEDAGPAAPLHISADPAAVFDAFASAGHFSHVAISYREAHRLTRLALAPLALGLWRSSSAADGAARQDDDLPPVAWFGEVPTFAIDQYVRAGRAAISRYVRQSSAWSEFANSAGVCVRDHTAAAGELLFRAEGARVNARRQWARGIGLYARSEPLGCFMPPEKVHEGLVLIYRELSLIGHLRSGLTTTLTQT